MGIKFTPMPTIEVDGKEYDCCIYFVDGRWYGEYQSKVAPTLSEAEVSGESFEEIVDLLVGKAGGVCSHETFDIAGNCEDCGEDLN